MMDKTVQATLRGLSADQLFAHAGMFHVGEQWLRSRPDVVMRVMERMIVECADWNGFGRGITYLVLCPDFPKVPTLGQAPTYRVLVELDELNDYVRHWAVPLDPRPETTPRIRDIGLRY